MPLRLTLIACLLAAALPVLSAATPPAGFRAGAATSNLTPPLGTPIVGGFAPVPAQDVHDELHARCLVLDDGRTRLALVICDLLGLHRAVSAEARRLIEEATGIPPSHVLVAGTHTHSAGSALGASRFAAEQPLDDYQRFVATRVADGVRRALNALRPAELGFGTVDIPEHVHNRRWVMRAGKAPPNPFGQVDKVKMNPAGGSPDLVEPAGPIDPTVSFLALREPGSGALISVFAAYSLHYVGGVGGRSISADYFGVFCAELERLAAHPAATLPCVALLANGTSGDINNIDFRLAKRPGRAPYEQMNLVGRDVARRLHAALAGISWERAPTLAAAYQELPVAWRTIPPELVAWARETEARAPRVTKGEVPVGAKFATTPDWVQRLSYAGRVQLLAEQRGTAPIPLQALRIGDVAIGTFPCETFAETGLEYRRRSPFRNSFMVELNHGYFGYLPTPRHFALGGYETWPGTNQLEPEASVKMLDALLALTASLQPSQARP